MVCVTGRYLYACQENYDEFLRIVYGLDENLRWRYMTATPIIDVTFDGNAFNVRSNTDGDLFFFDHIIGEESESNVNGRTQKSITERKGENSFITTVVSGKLSGLKATHIFMDSGFAMTLEKDGIQSTRMFKRIHKRGTRNSSLCEETPAEFHRSLSEAHISEVKL